MSEDESERGETVTDEDIARLIRESPPEVVLNAIAVHGGRFACIHCGAIPLADEEHWRVCEKHPARRALASAEARIAKERADHNENLVDEYDRRKAAEGHVTELRAALATARDDLLVLVQFRDIEPALDHARAAGRRIDAALAASSCRYTAAVRVGDEDDPAPQRHVRDDGSIEVVDVASRTIAVYPPDPDHER